MKTTARYSSRLYRQLSRWVSLAILLFAHVLTVSADVKETPINFQPAAFSQLSNANQLIVKFKNNANSGTFSQAQILNRVQAINQELSISLELKRTMGSGAQLFTLDTSSINNISMDNVITQLSKRSDIEYAVPNIRLYTMATPNDTRYNEQWHYYEATGGINMPPAWDINEGNGVIVAVIDTGYRPHVDLVANIVGGYDFISDSGTARDGDGRDSDASDEGDWFGLFECPGALFFQMDSSWHGTHVAGTISAVTNNSLGVAGIAPKAKVLPVRVLGKCGGTLDDIQDGMLWAAGLSVPGIPANPNPAQVINLSLGGQSACDASMQDVVNQVVAAGTTVVAAAGNSSADASGFTPASCNNVVTIAATNRSGGRASYSNFGSVVEVAAPGGETASGASNGVLSTLNTGTQTPENDNYEFYQGTSMASPHAAGVAALLYSHQSTITPAQVNQTLIDTARSFPASCSGCGAGIIDAAAALASLNGTNQPPNAAFSFAANLLSVSFTDGSSDSDGSIVSWSWDFGDTNSASTQNPVHSYASAGTYSVTLTVTDNEGAQDSTTQNVTVSDSSNQPPQAAFTYSANNLDISFTDQSSDADGNIVGWSWDFGDSNNASSQNPNHSYATAGTYTVTLTVTDDDGAQSSTSQQVTVTAPPANINLTVSTVSIWIFTQVSLNWNGATGTNIDIYENGSLYTTTANDGAWSEWRIGTVNSTFKVCEAGTSNCSDDVPSN
ncbi:S8 family serine peptidase [Aliikangiella coralliicola]|uniref:S8 family serine peptidase n=1 Tax=Aliikangiella coralliicola TaxID=2592383 RepID=A0A545UHU9_9GAMM|nr:S8 family serine peptidase [Aliikangiella coralliicola]TQV89046.1 S8 family serine peptidase [Aliikangiella coralliicola]